MDERWRALGCVARAAVLTIAAAAAVMLLLPPPVHAEVFRPSCAPRGARPSTGLGPLLGMDLAPPVTVAADAVGDVTHIKEVQAHLRSPDALTAPLVYVLGDSTAREAVTSEARLGARILRLTGVQTDPYVLASSNQTFPLDSVVADGLPKQPALALIAVGLSRFTNPPAQQPSLGDPLGDTPALSPWAQHKYDAVGPLDRSHKRALVRKWLAKRYPLFRRNEPRELAQLKDLVLAFQARGWTVAFFDMPVNTAVIGHDFDAPRARYRADCGKLAQALGITYIRGTGRLALPSRDFYDLFHLIAGRVLFEQRLIAAAAGLLPAPPRP